MCTGRLGSPVRLPRPGSVVRTCAECRPIGWVTRAERGSTLAPNGNRKAHVPTNGLLNYLYRLVEIEASLATGAVGLDPSIGLLHLDSPRRANLTLDLVEPVRPLVEAHVLELCARRTFRRADFVEGRDGCVRVMAPLAHELAETMPTWARAVAPFTEIVSNLLGDSITGKFSASTPLTGAKGRAAQASDHARKAAGLGSTTIRSRRERDPLAGAWNCPDCGGAVTNYRHVRCGASVAADPARRPISGETWSRHRHPEAGADGVGQRQSRLRLRPGAVPAGDPAEAEDRAAIRNHDRHGLLESVCVRLPAWKAHTACLELGSSCKARRCESSSPGR